MRLKIRYQQREERKTKSKSISSPCNWHWLRKKQRNMPSSRRLVVTTHRESRDADSESFRTSSICQNGGTWTISTLTMNLFWKETVLLLEAENTQNQASLKVRNYKQFLPMMSRSDQWPEAKYSNLYELWWLKYMYRHNNREIRNWKCARQFNPTETDHQHSEAASSQHSVSCGRPRAQGTGGNSPARYKAAPKPKLVSVGFSQRIWESISAKALTKKGLWIRKHLQALHADHTTCRLSWIRRSSTMDNVFTSTSSAGQTQKWNRRKVDWCTRSFCWQTQNGTLWGSKKNEYFHSCSTRTQSWCYNQSNLIFLKEIPLSWKEHIFHTGSPSNYKSTSDNGLRAGGSSLKSTRQVCFFSLLCPRDSTSRQRTIDRTRPVHEPRIVVNKQSYRFK